MTEQQQPNPIDDLFRKTFEQMPESPAASGWDKPSDKVWQNIQHNMQAAPKQGWSLSSIVLLTSMAALIVAGMYWFSTRPTPTEPQNVQPTATEQPVTAPVNAVNTTGEAADTAPKVSTEQKTKTNTAKPAAKPENNTAPASKSSDNAAQPLPGSKSTLPPNTTEANKHKQQ